MTDNKLKQTKMKRLRKLLLIAAALFIFAAAEAETVYGRITRWGNAFGEGWGNWTDREFTENTNIPCSITWGSSNYEIKFTIPGYKTFWGYKSSEGHKDKVGGYWWFTASGEDSDGKAVRLEIYLFWNDLTKVVIYADYYIYRFFFQIYVPLQ